VTALFQLVLGRPVDDPYPSGAQQRLELVRSVQDFLGRLRPLCEWTAFGGGHLSTTEWLVSVIDTLTLFRQRYRDLVRGCQPIVKRIAVDGPRLKQWLQSGIREMALHRAQFLPLGPSAIMHRFVCPPPARDCLLIVRARGYYPRALNSYCIGEAGDQSRTQWPHSAFSLGRDRRTDLTRIVFRPRTGKLESYVGSSRPALIVFRFGPAGSNRF